MKGVEISYLLISRKGNILGSFDYLNTMAILPADVPSDILFKVSFPIDTAFYGSDDPECLAYNGEEWIPKKCNYQ